MGTIRIPWPSLAGLICSLESPVPPSLGRLHLLALVLALSAKPAAGQCAYTEVVVPPDSSNSSTSTFLGEAVGQTFVAEETLIESITVWRVHWQANHVYGMRVFVFPVDSMGVPDAGNAIGVSPSVFHTDGDGVHPTAFEFAFDQPLRLPKTGVYEFAVAPDPCYSLWDILAVDERRSGRDIYPPGYTWGHTRSVEPCPPMPGPAPYPAADLCFKIRYCDGITPTQKSSWGQLKVLYR